MAREVVDRVAARLHEIDDRPAAAAPATDTMPLPGGETADLEILVKSAASRGVSDAVARHLVSHYGSEAAAVLNLVDRDRTLGEAMHPSRPEIWAEVTHAVEREMAQRVQDVLIRRLHLFHESPDQAATLVTPVARRMKKLLGWDDVREAEELVDYFRLVERARTFRSELTA
jgi:glycerol-3-phosphate dehydrogenase